MASDATEEHGSLQVLGATDELPLISRYVTRSSNRLNIAKLQVLNRHQGSQIWIARSKNVAERESHVSSTAHDFKPSSCFAEGECARANKKIVRNTKHAS